MSSTIDDYLDEVDRWKFAVADRLEAMTPRQRDAFWKKTLENAQNLGLKVLPKRPRPLAAKRKPRKTG